MSRYLIMAFVLILLITLTTISAFSVDFDHQSLPIELTEEEMTRLDEIGINHSKTSPPPTPIRSCAEWETSEGVIIRYPLGIPVSLVAEMSEDIIVTSIVSSSYYQSQAISTYTANGVNMSNAEFIIAPTNSHWTRDYGPWFIIDGNDEMAIVDHIYNRPRPQDDLIPGVIGSEWGMSVYGMSLETAGGNHMSDGLGLSMSTELVYNENPGMTHAQIDAMMLQYLGNDYLVLDYIESGGIHHIDCWAKLLGPSTIMIKDVPSGSSSYALLNARAQYMSQQISPWGVPYTVVRVYCPYGTAYTNSLILNDKVLVPTFGSSYDNVAIQVYQDAMPGYEVLGFDGSWYDNDAIHCRAMGVPDRGMLYIEHIPLTVVGDTLNDYPVSVKIHAYSNQDLITESLEIFYQTKGSLFSSTPLVSTAVADSFIGYIPAQPAGVKILYYLQAGDLSGRVETHPYIGADWAHEFQVNLPPTIIAADSLICPISSAFAFCPDYNDPDDDEITYGYSDYPGWLSIQNDSLVGTTPDQITQIQFMAEVSDPYYTTTKAVLLTVYMCDDANGDGSVNLADVSFIINFVFSDGPEPYPLTAADVNHDGSVNLADASYIINYIFYDGPESDCP